MNLLASGSIPADGSSSRIIAGLPTIAMATDSLRLFPPERVPAALSLCPSRSNYVITSATSRPLQKPGMPLILAKYSMFCATVSVSKIGLYCGQYPISFRTFWKCLAMSMPCILMEPEVASSSLVSTLKVVDFPAPLTPSSAKHSPLLRPKERFSTAQRDLPGLQGPEPRAYTLRRLLTLI